MKETGKTKVQSKISNPNGFTLLEAIIAMAIISVGILSLSGLQVSSIKGNAYAGKVTEATRLAESRIEYLTTLLYDNDADPCNPDASSSTHNELIDQDCSGVSGLGYTVSPPADHQTTFGQYTLYWNIADNDIQNNTKTVEVIVTWNSSLGGLKRVFMRYIIPQMI